MPRRRDAANRPLRRAEVRARSRWARASVSRGARSGANASFVASPAQTRSHSASWSSSGASSTSTSRSVKKQAPRAAAPGRARARRNPAACPWTTAGGRGQYREVLTEVERDPPGVPPERAGADPHDLAARAQLVHPRRRVRADAARAARRAPTPRPGARAPAAGRASRAAGRCRRPTAGLAVDALPGGQEAGERALVGGLDLLAQHGERRTAQAPQHLGMAPLAFAAAGPQLAADELAGALELAQRGGRVDAVAGAQLVRRERSVRLRVAAREPGERVGNVLQERRRQPAGGRDAERVAVEPGIGSVDQALLAGEANLDRPPLSNELLEHPIGVEAGEDAVAHLLEREVADACAACRGARPCSSPGGARSGTGGRPRRPRARPGRSGRAAPPGRAARGAGRGRATAPPRAARRSACRPRTCRWRRSRTAGSRRTARRSASRPRPSRSRGGGAWSAAR